MDLRFVHSGGFDELTAAEKFYARTSCCSLLGIKLKISFKDRRRLVKTTNNNV